MFVAYTTETRPRLTCGILDALLINYEGIGNLPTQHENTDTSVVRRRGIG